MSYKVVIDTISGVPNEPQAAMLRILPYLTAPTKDIGDALGRDVEMIVGCLATYGEFGYTLAKIHSYTCGMDNHVARLIHDLVVDALESDLDPVDPDGLDDIKPHEAE